MSDGEHPPDRGGPPDAVPRCQCGRALVPDESPLYREGALICPAHRPGEAEPHDGWVEVEKPDLDDYAGFAR